MVEYSFISLFSWLVILILFWFSLSVESVGIYLLLPYSSDSVLRHASSDFKKMGQRIFVFIVGGATRSEV